MSNETNDTARPATDTEKKALILAKALYLRGCEFARHGDRVNRMLAIHIFDNAMEAVLKIVAEHRELHPVKYAKVPELLSSVEPSYQTDLANLHNQRNNVQHAADIPHQDTVSKYMLVVEEVFRQLLGQDFGISYENLRLSGLIDNAVLRGQIQGAEEAFDKGDSKECIRLCSEALMKAVFEESEVMEMAGSLTRYWGGREELIRVINEDFPEQYKGKEYYPLIHDLSRAILQLAQSSTSMQFLGEYKTDYLEHMRRWERLADLSEEELKNGARESLDFVTNLILRWQEVEVLKVRPQK